MVHNPFLLRLSYKYLIGKGLILLHEETFIKKLNWFYTLEITQVENYLAQSKAMENQYLKSALERVAFIEEGHVDNIHKTIISLGHSPTLLGDVLSPIIGMGMGNLLGLTELATMMKLNIKVEAKAAADYDHLIQQLIDAGGERGIIHTLRLNMIDEDMHSSWFTSVISHADKLDVPLSVLLSRDF